MTTTAAAPVKRSIFFWGLTLSTLFYAIVSLAFAIYAIFGLYFGRGKEVLSEAMGREAYNNFLAETLEISTSILVIATFVILMAAMVCLIKKQYKFTKILLLAFVACISMNIVAIIAKYGNVFQTIGPIHLLSLSIIFALFFYAFKYERLSTAST